MIMNADGISHGIGKIPRRQGNGSQALPVIRQGFFVFFDHLKAARRRFEGRKYIVVDSVESLTGIEFFPALPDSIGEKIEGHIDLGKWGL